MHFKLLLETAKIISQKYESDFSGIESSEEGYIYIESDADESATGSSIKFVKPIEEITVSTISSVQDNQGSKGLNDDDFNGDYDGEVIPKKKQRTSEATRNSTKNATAADKWHYINVEAHNDQSPHDIDGTLHKLSKMISSFAKIKCQLSTPAHNHSFYTKWKPVTKTEILSYIAVTIVMDLQPRPEIRDY